MQLEQENRLYHQCLSAERGLESVWVWKGAGGGGCQSRYRRLQLLRHWLIYCICWARHACLSGLENLCLIKPVPSRDFFSTASLEVATYRKTRVGRIVYVYPPFQVNGNNIMYRRRTWVAWGKAAVEVWVSIWPQICLLSLNPISSLIKRNCLRRKMHDTVKSSQARVITCITFTKLHTLLICCS